MGDRRGSKVAGHLRSAYPSDMGTQRKKTVKATTEAPMIARRVDLGPEVGTDAIAAKAYELFLERGGEHGHDVEDWLRAEAALRG